MQVTPSQMRGQISAVYLFTVNLIGTAAGPTMVALMTDHVFRNDAMVGSSLLVVGIVSSAISVLFLWSGLKSYVRSQYQLRMWVNAMP
jgi:hypothetical protein